MNRLRPHLGIAALLAVVAPLMFAFCWHGGLATLGDDAMSYIGIARWLSPFRHDPLADPWVGYYSHFPPLFPVLLALTGGAWNFLVAHLLVAACAVAALGFVYAYGALRLDGPAAGLGLAVVVVLLPTFWISSLGILSEPLFLAVTLATLVVHERADPARTRDALVLGALLAAAWLTRVAGIALVAAYAAHVAIRAIARRRRPDNGELIALIVPVAAELAWLALRPKLVAPGYGEDLGTFVEFWTQHPAYTAELSSKVLGDGWVSSFTADAWEPMSIKIVLGTVAALGLAGVARGVMRNRLDSWYTLGGLAILFLWVFDEDNQRRLLYPLVPLVLCHAAESLAAAAGRLKAAKAKRMALLTGAALVAIVCAPAIALVAKKSTNRAPLYPDSEYSLSSMTLYYTAVNLEVANSRGAREAAVLTGLEAVGRVTPPDAKVMWVRPEYVAVLGRRTGEPAYFSWDRATFARELLRTGTTHVIVSTIFKADLAHHRGDAYAALAVDTPDYLLHPAYMVRNPDSGVVEFVLLKVDREALRRAVEALGPPR